MTSSDPWRSINVPNGSQSLGARRVDPNHPFNFFWAKDIEGHCLLVFEYDQTITIQESKPNLNGIEILEPEPLSDRKKLILVLRSSENREIFHHLCLDIVSATSDCKSESSALFVALRRTWRWHQLLRGGAGGRLGHEAQKGLIGELSFLLDPILDIFPASEALNFWQGPSGAPKDFSIGAMAVEVKARKGSARPFVSISSEFQLDKSGIDNLFLYVIDLTEAAGSDDGAFSLKQIIDAVRTRIEEKDSGAIELLESKLLEVGYLEEDNYSDIHWVQTGKHVFHITDDFPRLTHGGTPQGILDIVYKLDLTVCQQYEISFNQLRPYISGEGK